MKSLSAAIYDFGPFRLDTTKRLLLCDEKPVALPSKAYEALVVLVTNSGQVIEKDELMKSVWPNSFVEEANLTVCISALRKALGQRPNEPRYIVTVPGRGYQFVASVSAAPDEDSEWTLERQTLARVIIQEREVIEETQQSETKAAMPLPAKQLIATPRLQLKTLIPAVGLLLILLGAILYFLIDNRSSGPAAGTTIKSMAVLPFKPLTEDPGNEYLGLGMADVLITRLTSLEQIVVRSTSDISKYARLNRDLLSVGRDLKVDAVLEGRIQRIDDRMRVTVQLVRVADGAALWAGKFDDKLTDLFAIEDSISQKVTEALALHLRRDQRASLARQFTQNTEAYQLYLKGRYYWSKATLEDLKRAIGYFEQAIALDPHFTLAYVGTSDCYIWLSYFDLWPPKEVYPKALAAATKALELDEHIADAHVALASVKMEYEWDFEGAKREYRRAIELNPNLAIAHIKYAQCLAALGDDEAAAAEAKQAQQLEPVSLSINGGAGQVYYLLRRYDDVIDLGHKLLEFEPNFNSARWTLGLAYREKGEYDAAVEQLRKGIAQMKAPAPLSHLAYAYAKMGRKDEAKRLLEELKHLSTQRYVSSALIANIFVGLGDKDRAFEWLEKGYEERDFRMIFLKVAPMLDNLRSDPRFTDLLRRMGLQT
jgi:DNA-binding winged helix-turn-helix (wHTH) protein/TolB-like protein/Flp pilus assembly protein TadD